MSQDVEPPALEAIVEYVYEPESLHISEENVQAVLSAASLLQVCGARAACCGFLAGALAPDNALGIKSFAELHGCADLARAALAFVDAHFVEVGSAYFNTNFYDIFNLLLLYLSFCTISDPFVTFFSNTEIQ